MIIRNILEKHLTAGLLCITVVAFSVGFLAHAQVQKSSCSSATSVSKAESYGTEGAKQAEWNADLKSAVDALTADHLKKANELYNLFVASEMDAAKVPGHEVPQRYIDAERRLRGALMEENQSFKDKIIALKTLQTK